MEQGAASLDLKARAARVFPGGFTRVTLSRDGLPTYAARGTGAFLFDVEGRAYLDCANNFTTLVHGHASPGVTAALQEQAALGACFSFPAEAEIQLAEALCDRVESFEQIVFCNTGTEAVLYALKAARGFTGRPMIAKCEGAYHGMSDFAEISNDSLPVNWGEPLPARVPAYATTPNEILDLVAVLPFNDLPGSLAVLGPIRDKLACVLIDPMPSRAGLAPASREYLEGLRAFCTANGVLLIFDQVMNFRLAYGGVEAFFGITADLSALGKVIGGGLPVGAIAGPAAFMEVFSGRAGKAKVTIGGTFSANPMTMRAGHAALTAFDRLAVDKLNRRGEAVREAVAAHIASNGLAACITGAGSLFKLHTRPGPVTDYRSSFLHADERKRLLALVMGLEQSGLHLVPSGLGSLSTAMADQDIDLIIERVCDRLSETCA